MLSPAAQVYQDSDLTFKFAISATCLLVWDTIIHIDDEIEYIWRGPRSWMKWAYAFVRHFPYVAQSSILVLIIRSDLGQIWSTRQCLDWIIYQLCVMESVTITVEAVLIVRVYAMYNRSKAILSVVFALFLAEIISMISVIAVSMPNMSFTMSQCLITHAPNVFTTYWFLSLAFETILFGLTLIKFFGNVSNKHLVKHSILYVLVRDGTWAYALIFAIMLLNALMFRLIDNPTAGLCFFWELTTMSSAGSHVLLNLRRHGEQSEPPATSFWTDASMHFATGVNHMSKPLDGLHDQTLLSEQHQLHDSNSPSLNATFVNA
ncbi:hypothetical protein AcW1_001671 [Taiwanofungus camphoratus]|nr:hypothetical protein AcV5_000285 [Antrodia cinnamomea]KAI0944837.1 hypothetical protein AcV7_001529 [Antrodia cinnamomea]KAI0945452.1 hypothetical protein AcW1_001671 [Antrodia cinnamomea]